MDRFKKYFYRWTTGRLFAQEWKDHKTKRTIVPAGREQYDRYVIGSITVDFEHDKTTLDERVVTGRVAMMEFFYDMKAG